MKTYSKHLRQGETAEPAATAENEPPELVPDNPFARAAYEWNNALKIAAEKMWNYHPPMQGG